MVDQSAAATRRQQAGAMPRRGFQSDLDALVAQVREMGGLALTAVESAREALANEQPALCQAVIDGDDALDERFLDIQREALRLAALQAPVASDLRLLIAAMHVGLHLERIGDLAVNVAQLATVTAGLPRDPLVARDLQTMGEIACRMVEEAVRAFVHRDSEACPGLAETDDRVDALNRVVLQRVLAIDEPGERRRWGLYMDEASRQFERIADHAVDIAEQVWFLRTGELREFTKSPRVGAG